MATKTLGTIMIVILCILFFPLAIGLIGGAFGIVIGTFGAVFGVFFGMLGAIFGAIFGFFGWLFDSVFNWDHDFNICAVLLITVLVIVLSRNKKIK